MKECFVFKFTNDIKSIEISYLEKTEQNFHGKELLVVQPRVYRSYLFNAPPCQSSSPHMLQKCLSNSSTV